MFFIEKNDTLDLLMDKIICLGKNYPAHAEELGEQQPDKPVLFLKPPSTLLEMKPSSNNPQMLYGEITLPSGQIHHELEVVFQVAADLKSFTAFAVGLDLTRRDLQSRLKSLGQPWEIAKVFKGSTVVGPWHSMDRYDQFLSAPFELWANEQLRQSGHPSQMILSPEEGLRYAKEYFPILPGDLIFTGTPPGVGPMNPGDVLHSPGHFTVRVLN